MTQAPTETWTTRRLLSWIGERFKAAELDEPQLCAEILVCHVLGCERMRLYLEPDRPAAASELATLRALVKRALAHEPVQYLTGEAWFFGLQLRVDPRVLIPRDATETLVEHVLQHLARHPGFAVEPLVADIGTGSGAIALAIAKNLERARVIATDLSGDALDVARANAESLGLDNRIDFREGHLCEPLGDDGPFDLVLSNPPYIPDTEWAAVAPNVRDHEPTSALRGGPDGLELVRPLIDCAVPRLRVGGAALIETAASRAHATADLVRERDDIDSVTVIEDLEGHPRVVAAIRR
ncbi:MAG: peptide chain release factor N(5)-glutamine methyltransferase [Planctomycetota bacterium]